MLRRVQSTGDLHAYNMHAALRSPMHAVMEGRLHDVTQDDGVYRIGARALWPYSRGNAVRNVADSAAAMHNREVHARGAPHAHPAIPAETSRASRRLLDGLAALAWRASGVQAFDVAVLCA
jgi:hypothetical protein